MGSIIPPSATEMAPEAVPLYKSSSSGIRAPVTGDDSDIEYSGSSKSRRNSASSYYSGSSDLESEGFGSGEDDELASDQDERFVEKTDSVGEYAFPSSSGKTEELQVPVAVISRDSDDDSQGSEVPEEDDDDGFSGVVRVPSVQLLQRVDSVPKDRISELDSESRAKNDAAMEFAENLVVDNVITSSDGENGKDEILIEGSVPRASSITAIQDEVSSDEFKVSSLIGNEVHMQILDNLESDIEMIGKSGTADNLESDKNMDNEISESESRPKPTYNLFGYDSALGVSADQGAKNEVTQFSESSEILIHSEQGTNPDPENGETEHINQFNGENKGLVSFSSEEILRYQTQEIDDPFISDLDTTRAMIEGERIDHITASYESKKALSKGEKKKLDKLQKVREKYSSLLHRLGFSHQDSVATRVLYQLTVAEARFASRLDLVSAEEASTKFKSRTKEDSDFSLSILIIGKTGVGKRTTINSIFGETKTSTDAFQPATVRVKEIIGTIHGVKIKVFETPGLRTCASDQSINEKILRSIKKTVKKFPPDVVVYVDRLDTNITYLNDLPMFRAVASYLGSSIWSKSVVVLTHAGSLLPDESEGFPSSYDALVSKRSRALQQLIRLSSRELLQMNSSSMAPVMLVENNPLNEVNDNGESLWHFGESWRTKLLHLCYSIKTLSEVNSIVSIQNGVPFSLSSLLLSNVDPKITNGPRDDDACTDMEMAKSSHPEQEKGNEYDSISPFKPLTRSRFAIVPLQDIELPLSFNGDNPSFRYNLLEPSSHFLTRPVLESPGWDRDCGYDAVLVEYQLDSVDHFPAILSIQLIKDKKELNLEIHSSVSAQHGDDDDDGKGLTISGHDFLTLARKKLSYALKVEKKFRNLKKDTTNLGISVVYPTDQNQTSIGLSLMRCRGEIRYGFELESQLSINADSKLNIRAGLNNKQSFWVSANTSSCPDHLQLAAIASVWIASAIFKKLFP